LFTDTQADQLKKVTDYEGFLLVLEEKNRMPLDDLNTPSELEQVQEIIDTADKN
jgi:hypothetical protein